MILTQPNSECNKEGSRREDYDGPHYFQQPVEVYVLLCFLVHPLHRFAFNPRRISVTAVLRAVMQLFQYLLQLLGDRQAEVGGVLQDGEAVVGDGQEGDGRGQDAGLVQNMDVQNLGDAHQQEGQHLPAEAADHQLI